MYQYFVGIVFCEYIMLLCVCFEGIIKAMSTMKIFLQLDFAHHILH